MKICLFLIFVISFCFINATDPCNFLAANSYLPSDVKACFDTIPLDPDFKTFAMSRFKLMLDVNPFTDLLLEYENFDIYAELKAIEEFPYQSDFDFHFALHKLAEKIPDEHTVYTPPYVYSLFIKQDPYYLQPLGNTSKINTLYDNERFTGERPHGNVSSINGIPIIDYLSREISFNSRDKAFRFNNYLYTQNVHPFYRRYGNNDPLTGTDVYKFEDGTTFLANYTFSINEDIVISLQTIYPALVVTPSKKSFDAPNPQDFKFVAPIRFDIAMLPNYENKRLKEMTDNKGTFKRQPLTPSNDNITHNSSNPISYGFAMSSDYKITPYLQILSFNPTDIEAFKQTAIEFVQILSQNNFDVAVIDVIGNGGGILPLAEWLVDLFGNSVAKPNHNTTVFDINYVRAYSDVRITTDFGKKFFPLLFPGQLDPTSGANFKSLNCTLGLESSKKRDNYGDEDDDNHNWSPHRPTEFFSPIMTFEIYNVLKSFPFRTKLHIVSNGQCFSACSHFGTEMRSRKLAKIFFVGGITGSKRSEYSAAYGTNVLNWNIFGPPLVFNLTFGTNEFFHLTPPPREHNHDHHHDNHHDEDDHNYHNDHHNDHYHHDNHHDEDNHNHHDDHHHHDDHDDEDNHYHHEYKKNEGRRANRSNGRFIPNQYSPAFKFADEIIGWNEFALDVRFPNYEALYNLLSTKDSRIFDREIDREQSFCTLGDCYSVDVPCSNRN